MPSIAVVPEYLPASVEGGPVIGGVTFPRPNSRSTNLEPVRASVVIASGSERTYSKGRRGVHSLSWSKLTEGDVETLVAATQPTYVTYREDASAAEYVVSTNDGVSFEAVAGTFPIRYSASVTLRERDVR